MGSVENTRRVQRDQQNHDLEDRSQQKTIEWRTSCNTVLSKAQVETRSRPPKVTSMDEELAGNLGAADQEG